MHPPPVRRARRRDNAQAAAKATDAEKLGGATADSSMTKKPRAFESTIPAATNFANNAVVADSCTLHVPGADDTTSFVADNTETIALQKITNSDAVFNPTVTCTGDGSDDLYGTGRITAICFD